MTGVLALTAVAPAVRAAVDQRSWYDWCAVAPIVAAVTSAGENGKYTEVRLQQALRGDLSPGQLLRVDVRRANTERDRETHRRAIRLDAGVSYLVLLRPGAPRGRKRGAQQPVYAVVRGVLGARPLRDEGARRIIDGLSTLIGVQDAGRESA